MVESIYFLKPAWCGTHFAGLWPEQGLQPVTRATALRRWFVTLRAHHPELMFWIRRKGTFRFSMAADRLVERRAGRPVTRFRQAIPSGLPFKPPLFAQKVRGRGANLNIANKKGPRSEEECGPMTV